EAVRRFEAAGDLGWARTNLALLDHLEGEARDDGLREALRADPREPVARWLLGREVHPSPFHAAYGGEDLVLAVPTDQQVRFALTGDWRSAVASAATSPWRATRDARPDALAAFAWWPIVTAFVLLVVALAAFLPLRRARVVRSAPRTPAYQVLALLVPGSGHANELWGLLLLLPWTVVGTDLAWATTTGESLLGLAPWLHATVLGIVYAANTAGWAVELQSYRRRMRRLREDNPTLAKSYGLPPAPVRTDARTGPRSGSSS
ncbi:MAG: hypothetical protein WD336_07415, partial [Trueperaceae bacterium]